MELPETDHATAIMEHLLDESNISDIEHCIGNIRQKSKLLKILLMKGNPACMELFRAIKVDLKRNDLIKTMKNKSAEKVNRGIILYTLQIKKTQQNNYLFVWHIKGMFYNHVYT